MQEGWVLLSGISIFEVQKNSVVEIFTSPKRLNVTFSVNDNALGSVSVSPAKAQYVYGDEITIKAQAKPGARFTGWMGIDSGVETIVSLKLTSDLVVEAVFAETEKFQIKYFGGKGSLSLIPDKNSFETGESVSILFQPKKPYKFKNWKLPKKEFDDTLKLVIGSEDIEVDVDVIDRARCTLSVSITGSGTVTPNLKSFYYCGDSVSLTANPAPKWNFKRWRYKGKWMKEKTAQIIVNESRTISAEFIAKPKYKAFVSREGNGTVMPTVPKIGYIAVDSGASLAMVAKAAKGFSLTEVILNKVNVKKKMKGDTLLLDSITSDQSLHFKFEQPKFPVKVSFNKKYGKVTFDKFAAAYPVGTKLTLTAKPASVNYLFSGWTGDIKSKNSQISFTVTKAMNIQAVFIPNKLIFDPIIKPR